jgi:uncharacterized protein
MDSTNTNPSTDIILGEVIVAMKRIYDGKLKEVVLYGSYAKGEQDDESDIDVMVLVDVNDNELRNYDKELNNFSCDIGYKYMKVISLVDMSYEKFINWVNVVPFYKAVQNEGIILYCKNT